MGRPRVRLFAPLSKSRPTVKFKRNTSVIVVMYFRAAPVGVQVCFRRHTYLNPSARVTLAAKANYFLFGLLLTPCFSKNTIVALMYCPLPMLTAALTFLRMSTAAAPANSQYSSFCCTISADNDLCHISYIRRLSHPRNGLNFTIVTDKAVCILQGVQSPPTLVGERLYMCTL